MQDERTASAAAGQATIMEMQRGVWRFAALRALVAVGAPEQLRDGPLTVAELAKRCVDAGYLLSFAGVLTFSNATQLHLA